MEREQPVLYYSESDQQRTTSFQNRWDDIRAVADLRRSDQVLDVGCAEGRITLEVARVVAEAKGFDVSPERIAEATRLAAEHGIRNAAFAVGSIDDYPLRPLAFDVALFLAVWGKPLGGGRTVGAAHLRRILQATRRQLIIRVGVQKEPSKERRLAEILTLCDEEGFDALCFSRARDDSEVFTRGNLIVAHRRGTDARAGDLPPLALVPTEFLSDDPIVRSAASIEGSEPDGESPLRALPKSQARARERIAEIRRVADLRRDDRVLVVDVRSAGTSELASLQHGLTVESAVDDVGAEPSSFDVVLLESWGKAWPGGDPIGATQLGRLLRATRRQLILRAGLQNDPVRVPEVDEIYSVCEAEGFDVLALSRGRRAKERSIRDNLVVANRKGSGARTGELRGLALIPTKRLRDNAIVRGAATVQDRL
jgi:SAM-dependent methyltransferase